MRAKHNTAASGRPPVAVVFRSADSDMASEVVFGQSWGSLIDISNWGHVIDAGVLATLEYAVGTLKTPLIVILGHSDSAAMKTALDAWNTAKFLKARPAPSSSRRSPRSPAKTPASAPPTTCRPLTSHTSVCRCCTSHLWWPRPSTADSAESSAR